MSFPYLCLIGNFYYFRIRVPQDLQRWFPSPEIKRSLKTKDKKSAKLLATKWFGTIDCLFASIRADIFSEEQTQGLIQKALSCRTTSPTPSALPAVAAIPCSDGSKPTIESKPVSEIIEEFLKEHVMLGKWRDKTAEEMTRSTQMLVKVMGDKPIREIDRMAMVEYIDKLSRLPANMNAVLAYRGKSIEKLLAMNVSDPMSTASVNKYLSRANSLMIWAVRHGYIDRNPADGLHVVDKTVREDEERSTYSPKDIKAIKGALEDFMTDRPERYWVPYIGMYSGARQNEICQLYVEDVKQIEGIWCFDINDDLDKQLKNRSSRRIVPIHPKLVDMGLLQYVDELRKAKKQRLWENLEQTRDSYGQYFSRWYGRFNREEITDDPKKCFHSFRHLVCDTLKQAGVETSVITELVGHAHGGNITLSRYGKRYRPSVLLEALMKLDY